jgi:hypothetical protein
MRNAKRQILVDYLKQAAAEYGRASVYFSPTLDRYVVGRAYLTAAELAQVFEAAEAQGLWVEKFADRHGARFAWLTDQSRGPIMAIPPWAAVRGWS